MRCAGWGSAASFSSPGEAPHVVTGEYFERVLERLRPLFSSIGIEMFPMTRRTIPGAHRPGGGQPDRLPGDLR